LTQLKFDTTTQVPTEPIHSEVLGIYALALELLFDELTNTGQNSLNDSFHNLNKPAGWPTIPSLNPSNTSAADVRRIIQLAPYFVRPESLKQKHFTDAATVRLKDKNDTFSIKMLCNLFRALKESCHALFATYRYDTLQPFAPLTNRS
jgi:hypothetical protein